MPQLSIGLSQRHMAREQRGHHIFGDRALMPESVAKGRAFGKPGHVDLVDAGGRGLIELGARRNRMILTQSDTDHDLRRLECLSLAVMLQPVGDEIDLMARLQMGLEATQKGFGVRTVKDDTHRGTPMKWLSALSKFACAGNLLRSLGHYGHKRVARRGVI